MHSKTKIAVVGSHGVGKTTLIEEILNRKLFTYDHIHGIPRTIISKGFPMGKSSTVDAYVNYIAAQFKAERAAMDSENSVLISDRTTLDATAYARVNALLPRPYVPDYFVEMLHEVWLKEALLYDIVVFVPVEFPMKSDGIRDEDEKYRTDVGMEIEQLLLTDSIPFIKATGSLDERVDTVLNRLKHLI